MEGERAKMKGLLENESGVEVELRLEGIFQVRKRMRSELNHDSASR